LGTDTQADVDAATDAISSAMEALVQPHRSGNLLRLLICVVVVVVVSSVFSSLLLRKRNA